MSSTLLPIKSVQKIIKPLFLISFVLNLDFVYAASEDELLAQAREIHARVLVLDTHVDIPVNFATGAHDPGRVDAQVNLASMRTGGMDAAFFIVYVGQGVRDEAGYFAAKADALAKFDAIHRMANDLYPEQIGLARSVAELQALHASGKLVALIGVENGYAIGRDIKLLEEFRDRGARYFGLVHNGHNDLGDSAQALERLGDLQEEHGGLSAFGYEVVAELNRLGMLVDISHVSKATMMDATLHSRVPVIASHSSVNGVFEHPRNLDDEQLQAIKQNGGVVQIVAFDTYLGEGRGSTVSDLVDHIDYLVDLIGIEHVGIASDFGGGGGVIGWNNASETLNVTLELLRRGYAEEHIALIWGQNVLRIMAAAEAAAESTE